MIEVIQTKELKSTTRVEGILVQLTNKRWYAVTRFMPSRNPWFLRVAYSTTTGRLGEEVFLKVCSKKPDLTEGLNLLLKILNDNEEIPRDKIVWE